MYQGLRKGFHFLLVIVLVILISACGANNEKEGKAANSNDEKSNTSEQEIKLRVSWAGSQVRHDATLKALDLYMEKHPNITFEPEYMGFDTYDTKMLTYSAAKNLPDVFQIDSNYMLDYATRGLLLDLTGSINTEDVDQTLLDAGKSGGILYAIPIGANAIGLHYNKVMFEKLGIQIPDNGFTWDELIQLARDVKPKLEKGQYLLQDLSVGKDQIELNKYEIYQVAHGKGLLYTPEGKFNFDKDTYLAFNELFAQLRYEGVVPPIDVTMANKENDPLLDNLLNGTIMVQRGFAASLGAIDGVKPGEYGLMLAPRAEQSGTYLHPSQYFVIPSNSAHTEEAIAFIDWVINDEEAGMVLGLSRGPQVSQKIATAISENYNDVEKQQVEFVEKAMAVASPFTSRPKGYGNFSKEYNKISQQIGFGQITAEEGFEHMKKMWKETIGD